MSLTRLVISTELSADGFKSVCSLAPLGLDAVNNFHNYIGGVTGGNYPASLSFNVGAVKAAGTITFSSTGPTNNQTCTIGNVTFTAKTSGATGNQFNISATPATVAANLAAAINASASLSGIVTATSLLGVVTITAAVPGTLGNGIQLANVDLSNAVFVALSGGSDGTAYSIDKR